LRPRDGSGDSRTANATAQIVQPTTNISPVVPISITPVITPARPAKARVSVCVLSRIAS
jgi:hypothetical protein